jgi:hypothetical protein
MTMIMTVLKKDKTEVESRCCVCFAARKRERSQLRAANNLASQSHRPPPFPKVCRMTGQVIMRHYAHPRILINYYQNDESVGGSKRSIITSVSPTHDHLRM